MGEIERVFARAKRNFEIFQTARGSGEMREAWEDFIQHYGKALLKIRRLSARSPKMKDWAKRLSERTHGSSDPGLRYLVEARNVDQHGLGTDDGGAAFAVRSGGLTASLARFGAGPDATITFGENSGAGEIRIGGRTILRNFTGQDGVYSGQIDPALEPRVIPPTVVLLRIRGGKRQSEWFDPPDTCGGRPITAGSPSDLGQAAVATMEQMILDLKAQFPNP